MPEEEKKNPVRKESSRMNVASVLGPAFIAECKAYDKNPSIVLDDEEDMGDQKQSQVEAKQSNLLQIPGLGPQHHDGGMSPALLSPAMSPYGVASGGQMQLNQLEQSPMILQQNLQKKVVRRMSAKYLDKNL